MKPVVSTFLLAATLASAWPALAAEPVGYRVVASIKTDAPGAAQSLLMDAAGRRLYAARQGLVEVIDADAGSKLGQVAVAGSVGGIALAPELNRGFATSTSEHSLTVFDLKTLQVLKVLKPVGSEPAAVEYEPKSRRVFVASLKGGTLAVIAGDTGEHVGSVALGGRLRGIAVDTRGSVYVADEQQNVLHVVDARSLKAKGHIPTWPASKPTAVTLDDKERRVYVSTASGRMVVLDPDIGQMVGQVPIGNGDGGIAAQYGANRFVRLFVPTTDGQLTVVQNPKLSASVESTLPGAGVKTAAVAVDPRSGKAFVAGASEIVVLNK